MLAWYGMQCGLIDWGGGGGGGWGVCCTIISLGNGCFVVFWEFGCCCVGLKVLC